MTRRISIALLGMSLAACGGDDASPPAPAQATPTWASEIGAFVHARCGACHRSGGAGPFSLLEHEDAAARAAQLLEVLQSGFMPPWLPSNERGVFAGDRRPTETELARFAQWVELGAPRGAPSDEPGGPAAWLQQDTGWQLGEPDVVVEVPAGYVLPAEGEDVFRNFVLPVDLERPAFVRAVEILPSDPRVVHHAELLIDPSRSTRRLDAADEPPGFESMRTAAPPHEGLAWRLTPGTDLVLQMHLLPSGRPEAVGARVGLHFAPGAPRRVATLLHLGSTTQDIPAGERAWRASDSFTLPVAVRALGVYPHAHYLGKRIVLRAHLPDASVRELLRIESWDFNWQDEYHYATPRVLPAGTRLELELEYDNGAENPLNPSHPPRRVTWGPRSGDEMGDVWLQVEPVDVADLRALALEQARAEVLRMTAGFEAAWARDPTRADHAYDLGTARLAHGRLDEAQRLFEAALDLEPEHVEAGYNLGVARMRRGDPAGAERAFVDVLAIDPNLSEAHLNLSLLLARRGEAALALGEVERAAELAPRVASIRAAFGLQLAQAKRLRQARTELETAVRLAPEVSDTWNNLGAVRLQLHDAGGALSAFRRALELDPTSEIARKNVAALEAAAR